MSLHYHPLAHIHPPFKRERGCHILIRRAPISFFQISVMTSFNVFQPLVILLHSTRMTLFIYLLLMMGSQRDNWEVRISQWKTSELWFHTSLWIQMDRFSSFADQTNNAITFRMTLNGIFFLGGFWKSSVCSYLGKKSSPTINYDYQ